MSKREQALAIEPKNEIHFKGPYNRVVTEFFKLSNPTEKPIAFKVKTTAPKRYCVRPNNGTIAPGKQVQVAVMLQPLVSGDQPSALEKNKHKFMIQSVIVATDVGNPDDLFKSVPTDEIMDSKFRCVFDDNTTITAAVASGGGQQQQHQASNRHHGGGGGGGTGSDSDNDNYQGGGDKNPRGGGSPSGDAESMYTINTVSSSSIGPSLSASAHLDSSLLLNGGDDDHYGGGYSSTTGSMATTIVESGIGGGGGGPSSSAALELKRLQEENRKLEQKLQELERASRGGGGAYNRFGQSSGGVSQQSSSQQQQKSAQATLPQQQQPASILDQPLSGQVIITVLISLLIGFILGKLDLGLF